MNLLLSTLEIALLIMLPLILFYQKSNWEIKSYLFWIPLIYILWYLSYGLIHEFIHLIGVWISGKEIFNYQLIPKFWEGQFGVLFVEYDFQGDTSDFFIIALPYFKDLLFVLIGYQLIKKTTLKSPFLVGLILTVFIFSSLYDVTNNYLAYLLLGYKNDFNALKVSSNAFLSHFIGSCILLVSAYFTVKVIAIGKHYPTK